MAAQALECVLRYISDRGKRRMHACICQGPHRKLVQTIAEESEAATRREVERQFPGIDYRT